MSACQLALAAIVERTADKLFFMPFQRPCFVTSTAFLIAMATALALMLVSADASAGGQRQCARLQQWLNDCSQRAGVPMLADQCHQARIIVTVGEGEHALDVELTAWSDSSFRRTGNIGVSPVGEFADWFSEPEQRIRAFDALLSCLEAHPNAGPVADIAASSKRVAPWLLVGAAGAMLIAVFRGRSLRFWWSRVRKRRWTGGLRDGLLMRGPVGLGAVLLMVALVFLVRLAWIPMHFFHQNGQGPLWIEMALSNDSSRYGPGYAEVFNWVARLGSWPDQNVFLAMALFAATIPVSLWFVARSSGASLAVTWSTALCASFWPLLVRLAHSESYFAIQQVLLFDAAALLAWAGRNRQRGHRFLWAIVAAGLLVSQAARIHPTSWAFAAVVPLVLLVQPGFWASRICRTLLAAGGIGAITAATSLSEMWRVYFGQLGQQYPAAHMLAFGEVSTKHVVLFAVLVIVAVLGRFRAHALLVAGFAPLAAFCLLLAVSNHNWGDSLFDDALQLQALPTLIASGVACIGIVMHRLRKHGATFIRWWFAPSIVCIAAAMASWRLWDCHTTVPIDALEQSWAMVWRNKLPSDAQVVYLKRVQNSVLALPLYSNSSIKGAGVDARVQTQLPLIADTYYYRSSLCSSDEGKAICSSVERRSILSVVTERDLPARASMPWLPLGREPIRVGLYRVEGLVSEN